MKANTNHNQAPELEGERLKLRSHGLKDFSHCVQMWADPEVYRYTTGVSSNEQRTWTRFLSYAGHWVLMGYGFWAIEEKVSKRFIGEIGVGQFKRDMTPTLGKTPEVGWALATEFQGKGYATEALSMVTQWMDAHLSVTETACIIHPENKASLRVAAKCGYRLTSQAEYMGETAEVLFRRK